MANPLPAKPKLLGQSLKWLRETKKESLAEAAGAIEVDDHVLERYESGQEVPSEDILLLLFNHFEVDEGQAIRLRRLAGYDSEVDGGAQLVKMPVVLLGMDQRVIYSDGLHIDVNPEGLMMTFSQGQDPAVPVSRVGMSHTQAENVMKTLEQALLRLKYLAGPLALPPTASDQSSKKPKS